MAKTFKELREAKLEPSKVQEIMDFIKYVAEEHPLTLNNTAYGSKSDVKRAIASIIKDYKGLKDKLK